MLTPWWTSFFSDLIYIYIYMGVGQIDPPRFISILARSQGGINFPILAPCWHTLCWPVLAWPIFVQQWLARCRHQRHLAREQNLIRADLRVLISAGFGRIMACAGQNEHLICLQTKNSSWNWQPQLFGETRALLRAFCQPLQQNCVFAATSVIFELAITHVLVFTMNCECRKL